jgi:hypothetical protein
VRELGEARKLLDRVDRPQLGRLRDGDDARLDVVLVARAREQRLKLFGAQLPVGGRQVYELAAREALRRAALVHVDVGGLGADDRVEGARDGGQRRDVRARPAEDEEDLRRPAEPLAEEADRPLGVDVVAVGDGVAVVGRAQRVHHARVDARVVVARESSLRSHLFRVSR